MDGANRLESLHGIIEHELKLLVLDHYCFPCQVASVLDRGSSDRNNRQTLF
jgi:hypothetical protein